MYGDAGAAAALYVVFDEPLAMVSDAPSAYANQPSFSLHQGRTHDMGRIQVLNGEPGEFVTIARRHDDEWYLGSLDQLVVRDLPISLHFLGKKHVQG